MDTITLENKWAEIPQHSLSDHKSMRISNDCIPDLYLGYNTQGSRCLILSLAKGASVDFKNEIREYISIQFFDKSRHIIIQLNENRFTEIFNAFIISVYHRIKSIDNSDKASKEIIRVYYEWSEFFSELESNTLSFNEVLGLVGELFILNRLIKENSAQNINDILRSWTGPFDKSHDFTFSAKEIEVKTMEFSKIEVSIASEFQLEIPHGKLLELIVVSVLINTENGITLQSIILETKDLIISKLGELPIFFKAIARKGLTMLNLAEYDNYKFLIKSLTTYDCMVDGFPKLSVSNIPKEIRKLQYILVTNKLTDYIIEKIEY